MYRPLTVTRIDKADGSESTVTYNEACKNVAQHFGWPTAKAAVLLDENGWIENSFAIYRKESAVA